MKYSPYSSYACISLVIERERERVGLGLRIGLRSGLRLRLRYVEGVRARDEG